MENQVKEFPLGKVAIKNKEKMNLLTTRILKEIYEIYSKLHDQLYPQVPYQTTCRVVQKVE